MKKVANMEIRCENLKLQVRYVKIYECTFEDFP